MTEIMFYIMFIPLSHVNETKYGCKILVLAPGVIFRGNTVPYFADLMHMINLVRTSLSQTEMKLY